jgi:hypothetical protein
MHTQPPPPSRATSPLSHQQSNTTANDTLSSQLTYKQFASCFYTINSKYWILWECAELLIELGSGTAGATSTATPPTSVSVPAMQGRFVDRKKSPERAITLTGNEAKSKPPTPTPTSGLLALIPVHHWLVLQTFHGGRQQAEMISVNDSSSCSRKC